MDVLIALPITIVSADAVFFSLPSLTSLYLPQLSFVGGSFNIESTSVLPMVTVPLLATIGETLAIPNNEMLSLISMPQLASASLFCSTCKVVISNNPVLQLLSLPQLIAAEADFIICSNGPLFTIPSTISSLWPSSAQMCTVSSGDNACPDPAVQCSDLSFVTTTALLTSTTTMP
jgi:hypothetical protein